MIKICIGSSYSAFRKYLITAIFLSSTNIFAQDIQLECDVVTSLTTTGVGTAETKKKLTLRINQITGVLEGGIAGALSKLDNYHPKLSEKKFSGTGSGFYEHEKDLYVPVANYEIDRYSGTYKANLTLLAYGRLQQQEEVGHCKLVDKKF
ncbi:MAG: hypothetical protein RI902_1831 [Pseudomonadota bacterium]|jgi:hypothetical protein